jgi:Tfp pilus assembly protein PilF
MQIPILLDSHLAVANIMRNKWEWSAAETEIKRALELNPNLVDAHNAYAILSGNSWTSR